MYLNPAPSDRVRPNSESKQIDTHAWYTSALHQHFSRLLAVDFQVSSTTNSDWWKFEVKVLSVAWLMQTFSGDHQSSGIIIQRDTVLGKVSIFPLV